MTDGIVVIDKPLGFTSHDVVARMRRCLGMRRIGHAGTLDPQASGVLVLGVGKATRLLTYLVGDDKEYDAVIRLGAQTVTDDAEGDVISRAAASDIAVLSDEKIREVAARFIGSIQQRPSAVSAVKIDGQRAYARVRAGEEVELPARDVTIHKLQIDAIAHEADHIDLSVRCAVSSGTYIRALARDIGELCGVGGHVQSLRRTRSGKFTLARAVSLPEQGERPEVLPLSQALALALPVVTVEAAAVTAFGFGRTVSVPADFINAALGEGVRQTPAAGNGHEESVAATVGVLGPGGSAVCIAQWDGHSLAPHIVFT